MSKGGRTDMDGTKEPTADRLLIIGLLEALDQALSKKARRKYGIERMRESLRESIPENGTGPLIAARKEALAVLDEYIRLSERWRA